MSDDFLEPLREIHIAQEPDQPVEQKILHGPVKIELDLARYLVVERIDLAVELDQIVAVADRRKGGGDRARRAPV